MPPQGRTKNAIEKRLDYLANHWNRFADDPAPRALRWMVDEDGVGMLDAFFEVQSEEVLDIPDLFIRLNSPCDSPGYGHSLADEFLQQYEADRDALAEEGLDASWRPPAASRGVSGIDRLLACVTSFQQHYAESVPLLALALTPSNIGDVNSWPATLNALIRKLPASIRITVVDRLEAPLLGNLADEAGGLMMTVMPDLDMGRAILQLANEDGRTGPGIDFRRRFMELAQLVPGGDALAIREKAASAVKLAQEQNWPTLQFAVEMMVAAAHCAGGRTEEAIAGYRTASQTAARAEESHEPAAAKLMLQARFGEAAALLQNGSHQDAAAVYQDAAPGASETSQPLLEIECWRMAGYCHQQADQPSSAWQALWNGITAAETLDESARRQSTLPYVGEALLALADKPEYRVHTRLVQERMTALLGPAWREAVETGAQPV